MTQAKNDNIMLVTIIGGIIKYDEDSFKDLIAKLNIKNKKRIIKAAEEMLFFQRVDFEDKDDNTKKDEI